MEVENSQAKNFLFGSGLIIVVGAVMAVSGVAIEAVPFLYKISEPVREFLMKFDFLALNKISLGEIIFKAGIGISLYRITLGVPEIFIKNYDKWLRRNI